MKWLWAGIFALILTVAAAGIWMVFLAKPEMRTLSVAAGSRGSDSHVLMSEIGEVLRRHSDILRLEVRENRSSSDSISQINRGVVDLATIQSNTPAYTNINLVADIFADYFLLISRSSFDPRPSESELQAVENFPQIRSRRIAIPESGTSDNFAFWSVVDHYKVPPQGFSSLALPRQKAIEAFLDNRVEAIFFVSSLLDPVLVAFIQEAGLRNIPLKFVQIEQAEAMTLKRPYLKPAKIVRGAFDGELPLPETDVVVPSLHRLLVANADVDEALINELVRVIFENRLDLLIRMSLSAAIQDPRREGVASLPLHPGAARFYDRDQPTFLQENAEPMALIVTIIAMLVSALLALRRSLQSRAKNRGDRYNDLLLEIAQRARDTDSVEELEEMKRELVSMLERVVHALDADKVTEEGFQSFSFLWASTKETIGERIRLHS